MQMHNANVKYTQVYPMLFLVKLSYKFTSNQHDGIGPCMQFLLTNLYSVSPNNFHLFMILLLLNLFIVKLLSDSVYLRYKIKANKVSGFWS